MSGDATRSVFVAHAADCVDGEYVGRRMPNRRGSVLANPFRIGQHGDRAAVIARYRVWLSTMLSDENRRSTLHAEIDRLRLLAERPEGVTLLCWCAPRSCHADVIRRLILTGDDPTKGTTAVNEANGKEGAQS